MPCVVGGDDDARSDRLFAQKIIEDLFLNAFHDMVSKEPDHSQVHACIHQPKRIAGRYDTIEFRQLLKSTASDLDLRVRLELLLKGIAEFSTSIDKQQLHIS
jgi:hypothetical protein